ncbi:MAG: hypothetical protein ACR2NW_06905 [Thermodesulfobacteriota bacterium]
MKIINKHSASRLFLAFIFSVIGLDTITDGFLAMSLGGGKFFLGEYKYLVGGFFIVLAIFLTYRAIDKH